MPQIRIRMRTLAAGPAGVMLSGEEYDVEAGLGAGLVAGGYAEPVGAPGTSAVEAAQLPEGEKTVAPAPGRKPRAPRAPST
jgi:hypothetical protein